MGLYKNRYRTKSTRLKEWDYSSHGYYFVTICTKNQRCFFGKVFDGKAVLTKIGEIAKVYWQEIPEHFQNVRLDESVFMPNHVHGIVILGNVETCHGMSLQRNLNTNKFSQPISSSLSTIISQYKSTVTRGCRRHGYNNFAWQPRFYDHIIRSEKSLEKIREYIVNNPIKWESDEYHPDKLGLLARTRVNR